METDTLMLRNIPPRLKRETDRFWAKVDQDGPMSEHAPELGSCWIWTGALKDNGYGVFMLANQRTIRAHRYAYELLVEPIPEGFVTDHLCRTRSCVNPVHLEVVTQRENLLRGETITAANAAKTHCPQGHEYTSQNTRISRRRRECKQCRDHRDRSGRKR